MFRPFMLAGALLALSLQPAASQQPTSAQRDAIRASCRSDYIANCSNVTPGGKEAFECLLRNQAKLSPACNSAVSAIATSQVEPKSETKSETKTEPKTSLAPAAQAPAPSAPAPAAVEPAAPKPAAAAPAEPAPKPAASQEAQLKSVRQACTLNDFMAHCSWIKPSNPELVLCLQSNASDLSPHCQAALQGLPPPAAEAPSTAPERKPTAEKPSKKSTAVREPAPPAQASAPAAAPAQPSEAQKAAIRAACRSDFIANCSGVQPGGAAALQCLKSNSAKLSSSCQSAVAAIGGGGAPAASSSATPDASVPTPAVAPLGPIPPMRPREALGILAMCRVEQQTICGGIPFGGGRVLTCLADHAPQLSLQCYEALARATR
jgi:outer membrane biosynthesis protein TonB